MADHKDMTGSADSPRTLYDETAARWVRKEPLSLSDFTGRPPVLALCQPVSGLRVLDLGCGEGYCARQLKQAGARDVLGIDASSGMIRLAQAQEAHEPLGIRYEEGDATDLSRLQTGEIDLVLAMFLFNYLSVAQTRKCVAEVARILHAGGKFVFAVPHPSLAFLRKAEPPFYFQIGEAGYFTGRDTRFPGRIWKRDGTPLEVQMVHKTLEDYFEALRLGGFRALPVVRELHVTREILEVDPPFFGPLNDIPLHLAVAIER